MDFPGSIASDARSLGGDRQQVALLESLERFAGRSLVFGREAEVLILAEPTGGTAIDRCTDPLGLHAEAVAFRRVHPGAAEIELMTVPGDAAGAPTEPVVRLRRSAHRCR